MAAKTTISNVPTVDPIERFATPIPLSYAPPVPGAEQPMTGSRAYFVEPQPAAREPTGGGPKYLVVASIIIGIALGIATMVSGLGRAFYVEKDAYTQDKIKNISDLNAITSALAKATSSLERLEAAVDSMSADIKEMRGTPQRRTK